MVRDLYALMGILALLIGVVFCAAPIEVTPTVEVGTYTDVPTSTDTPVIPTETERPTPSASNTATKTPTPQRTRTLSPTPMPYSALPVVAQGDIYGGGCQWMGVAGQVFGTDDFPVFGIIVRLNGGGYTNIDRFTGDDPEYGPGGYEFFLATPVRAGRYTLQLFQANGAVLSLPVVVETTADCNYNLYVVNFSGPGIAGAP